MANQLTRSNLFDDFFKDFAPGFFIKPLHGDALPSAAQIRIDVKESDSAYTVLAELPGVQLPVAAGHRPGGRQGQVRKRRAAADAAEKAGQRRPASGHRVMRPRR